MPPRTRRALTPRGRRPGEGAFFFWGGHPSPQGDKICKASPAPSLLSRPWVPRYPWRWEDAPPSAPPAAAAAAAGGDGGTGAMLGAGDPRPEESWSWSPPAPCRRCGTRSPAGVSSEAEVSFPSLIAFFFLPHRPREVPATQISPAERRKRPHIQLGAGGLVFSHPFLPLPPPGASSGFSAGTAARNRSPGR